MPVKIGATYKHSKRGTCYLVLHIGKLEATQEPHVVYRSLVDGTTWIRPVKEWNEPVEFRVNPHGASCGEAQYTRVAPRFELVGPQEA